MSTSSALQRTAAVTGLVIMTSCGESSTSKQGGEVVRIGVFLRQGVDGADEVLAAREINEAGGITIDGKDYQIDLVRVLQGETPATGVAAISSLVEQGVVAAVGPRWSSVVLGEEEDHGDGAAQAAVDQNLLLVSGHATSAAITTLEDDDLMWRTIPSDDLQGDAAAKFAFEGRGVKRAAVLYRDDPYGRGLSGAFESAFQKLGGEILQRASYAPAGDLYAYAYPQLDKLFAGEPDAVFIASFEEFSQISNRIVQGGHLLAYGKSPPQFMTADGATSNDILTNAAPEVLSNLVGTTPGPSPDAPNFKAFADAYVNQELGPRDAVWPYTYDAVYLIALAIQAAQSTDPQDFKKHIRAVSRDDGEDTVIGVQQWAKAKRTLLSGGGIDYQGASGPLDLTQQGDPGAGRYSLWRTVSDDSGGFRFDESEGVEFKAE